MRTQRGKDKKADQFLTLAISIFTTSPKYKRVNWQRSTQINFKVRKTPSTQKKTTRSLPVRSLNHPNNLLYLGRVI
jgi:hypothetical protein